MYYIILKMDVQENEAVVSSEFSENYSFVVQDEAQFFYWNNKQTTVHPCGV